MTKTGVLAALLLCAACASDRTVRGDGFVLHSPFGPEATETWERRVAHELVGVEGLLVASRSDPPIDVWLEAIDVAPDADVRSLLAPQVDGVKGWTIDGEVHVIVPREKDGLFTTTADDVLRHEFVHALLRRDDVRAPAWLGEGLAHEVEDAVKTADGLRLHPAPVELAIAKAYATTFDVSRVWSWDGAPNTTDDDQSALRLLSRSFVRFLIERDGDDWPRRVPEWATIRPAEDPSQVAAWRTWLETWDVAVRVERARRDHDPAIRAAAANALPSLAECAATLRDRVPGIERSVDARTDALALKLATSDDPALADPAGRYLVYFRARDVSESALHALSDGAAPPWARLVALAVAKRRGGNADPSEVTALWNAMPEWERMRFLWVRSFLPIGDQRRSAGGF